MESWQQPCSPDDLVELAYLGLNLVFGSHVGPETLLECARDAMEKRSFYQALWNAGKAFDDVRLSPSREARLRNVLRQNHGALICTFQIGPFLQLPFMLAKMGVPVMLLMDPENFENGMKACSVEDTSKGVVPRGYWPQGEPAPGTLPVQFVTSSDQSTSWKIVQWLKSGKVVFAYLDGNRGLEGFSPKNSVSVPFFGADIWVRKGLAHLAGFAGAPMMLLVGRKQKDGDHHEIHLSPPMRKREDETLERFSERAVLTGYRLLEAHVRQDVACWNEWYQIHRWAVRSRKPSPASPASEAEIAEKAVRSGLRLGSQLIQLRFGEHDVIMNQKNGVAIVFTQVVSDVLRLAGGGNTVEQIVEQLAPEYEEQNLLEVIHSLAKDSFLQVNPE
jgi:hypothetical protein